MEFTEASKPYVGLQPYGPGDKDYFAGRESDIRIINANLAVSRLTVFYGPSGVGKTSLLQAGVVPAMIAKRYVTVYFNSWQDANFAQTLRKQVLDGITATFAASAESRILKLPAWPETAEIPAAALGGIGMEPIELAGTDSLDVSFPLDEILLSASRMLDCPVLLVLDQFEDYLNREFQDDELSFDAELARSVNQREVKANVLISIREDELYQLDRMRGRIQHLLANTIRLEPLTPTQADVALRQPLQRFNDIAPEHLRTAIPPEDDPIPTVVAGAREEGDIEAAFLQLVMERLWEAETALFRQGKTPARQLRLSTLNSPELGGVRQVIATYMDRIMGKLSDPERGIAARMFAALVTRKGHRIALEAAQLIEISGATEADARRVLELLRESGILKPLPSDRYEVTHDVVARSILSWRRSFQEQDRVRTAIREAQQKAQEEQDRIRAAIEEAQERADERTRNRVLIGTVAGSALLAVALFFAVRGEWKANASYLGGQAQLVLDQDPELSVLLSRYAIQVHQSPNAWDSLYRAVDFSHAALTLTPPAEAGRNVPADVYAVAYSPDGHWISTSDDIGEGKGNIHIYDAATGKHLRTVAVGSSTGDLAYSSLDNGRWLASASDDGFVRIWDMNDGSFRKLAGNSKQVWGVAFSPDGKLVASAGEDGRARMWEVSSGIPVRTFTPSGGSLREMKAIAFSPAGDVLATAGFDKKVRLWDVKTGGEIAALEGHGDKVYGVAFSPHGSMLATASWDGTAIIWDAATHKAARVIPSRSRQLWGVRFSPEGDLLATTARNGVARLWNASTGDEVIAYPTSTSNLTGLAFSPDGKRLATVGYGGFVKVWDVPYTLIQPEKANRETAASTAPGVKTAAIAFDSQGERVAVSDSNEGVSIWDLSAHKSTQPFKPPIHSDEIRRIRFDKTGQFLVTASADHTAKVWSVSGQSQGPPLRHDDEVRDAVFSDDGTRIATAGWDSHVKWWSVPGLSEAAKLAEPPAMARMYAVAFSPDGKFLAAGGQDKHVWVWDLSQPGKIPIAFQGLGATVTALQFSPDGKLIAAGGVLGAVRIWRFTNGAEDPGRELRLHDKAVTSLEFSSNGRLLATGSEDADAVVVDARTFETKRTTYGHRGFVLALSFGLGSDSLLTAGSDLLVAWHALDQPEVLRIAKSKSTRAMTGDECGHFFDGGPCPALH